MRRLWLGGLLLASSVAFGDAIPGTHKIVITPNQGVRAELLKNIAPIVDKSIAAGYYPGAVIYVSHHGHLIYQGVFGQRRLIPEPAPMQANTIFDLASLTKVVATTPAVMQLLEQNKLGLDDPVAKYWPAFAGNGKEHVTIRELMTHTSGLPPDIDFRGTGEAPALQQIAAARLSDAPGTHYIYSDVNFIVLAYLVEVVSHEPFDRYVKAHVFKPLGMNHTGFLPDASTRDKIAPTELLHGQLRWGVVDDPSALALGGVAGNAGLFSTASDLGIYAQCLLNQGRVKNSNHYILAPLSVLKMTTPQTPTALTDTRGLGWDIDSAYSSRGQFFPVNSYGHTGWTGTSIWIDPVTQTWIIMLTNRVHPKALKDNAAVEDRREIANIVASSLTDVDVTALRNTGVGEIERAYR